MSMNPVERTRRDLEAGVKREYPEHRLVRTGLPVLNTCVHLGARVPGQPCGSQLMRCELHDCVTTRFVKCEKADRHCATCPDYSAKSIQMEWVSTAQLVQDAVLLAAKIPADCSGIVGIPRSGLLPATVVATHLHLPLWELTPSGPRLIGAGSRGGTLHKTRGPLAVVDDTVYGGTAMKRARGIISGSAVYCSVYVHPDRVKSVDLFTRKLPSPHLLEWNAFNNAPFAGSSINPIYGRGVATDFDGILCHDAESGGVLGGPYLIPRAHPVRLIVTGRQESTRPSLLSWLSRHGVRAERVVMLPDDVLQNIQTIAELKAREYRDSPCGFFFESDPAQAELIRKAAGKPVVCPRAGKVF